jgi:DNA-binding transcriptional ArsR family regulator
MFEATTPVQLKALAHPLRQRLLFSLGERPATISQLAAALGAHKGNIAHHLKVLRNAGMVEVTETRQVRGGTEQYYQRTAQRIFVGGPPGASTTAMIQAMADEIAAASEEPLLVLRHLRLTAAHAERLTAALSDLVHNADDDGLDQPRYGLLVGLYQSAGR